MATIEDVGKLQAALSLLKMHHGSKGQGKGKGAGVVAGARRSMWKCFSCETYNPLGKTSCASCGHTPSSERTTKPAAAAAERAWKGAGKNGKGKGKGKGTEGKGGSASPPWRGADFPTYAEGQEWQRREAEKTRKAR